MNPVRRAATLAFAAALVSSSLVHTPRAASKDDELRAPARLADTGLYAAGGGDVVDPRNRPFAPQYPLWSDGAAKRRWVSLPAGTTIDITNVDAWEFPVGTRFWKEFSFQGRKVETRLLWKASATRWVAASYVWNEDGTDAVLAPEGGTQSAFEVAPGRRHEIPSTTDCLACHGTRRTTPLGFNALQLSTDRDPRAIHGEPLAPGMVTLGTLVSTQLVSPRRQELVAAPPRIATADPQTRAMLGYLSTNCGSCHNGEGDIAAMGPFLGQRDLLSNGDALARALVGHATKWQVPGTPDGTSVLIDPASPETSAILTRMRSRRPSSQMPPLGTAVRDQEAVDAITRWILDRARTRQ
jgi:mono/diheme cytochrome c family protein